MLTFVVGANGSGKSLFAMHKLIEELRSTDRLVVTTLSVNQGRLNEYVQQRYPREALDVCGRVFRIGRDELVRFWRYRNPEPGEYEATLGSWGNILPGGERDARWSCVVRGICFFLDEVQSGFGARSWQQTSGEFTEYQPQHRKLGDDVWAISPSSSLVDKQFRILCGRTVILQNQYQAKFGLMKMPRRIVARYYEGGIPSPGQEAYDKEVIHIDAAGLAGCYDTGGGLGVGGVSADKGKEAGGIPWWVLMFIGAPALGLVMWLVATGIMHGGMRWGVSKMSIGQKVAVSVAGDTKSNAVPAVIAPAPAPVVRQAGPATVTALVSVPGAAFLGPVAYGYGVLNGRGFLDTADGPVHGRSPIGFTNGGFLLDGVFYPKGHRDDKKTR